VRRDIETLVESAPQAAWTNAVHGDGWDARELLSHMASTSGVANFILMLAEGPAGAAGGGGAYDIDQFNAQQVAMRAGRSVAELLDEVRANIARDIAAVENASDELLAKRFRAPWDVEGPVAEVIVESLRRHFRGHLEELAAVLQRR
jgi:hypothetical protein